MTAKQGSARFAAILGAVVLLYVLSSGPAEIYSMRHPGSDFNGRLATFYAPLGWACDNVPGFRPCLQHYIFLLHRILYPPRY